MQATILGGNLREIPNCMIIIPFGSGFTSSNLKNVTRKPHVINFKILPEISDRKSASYQDVPVIGRSFPIKNFSHSENRSVTMKLHFAILEHADARKNMQHLRALQSATYPREGSPTRPFLPPPICQIGCGDLLSKNLLCAVMKDYSVSFPTDVAWYEFDDSYLPYKFDVDCSFDIVYSNENLPGQESILLDFASSTEF